MVYRIGIVGVVVLAALAWARADVPLMGPMSRPSTSPATAPTTKPLDQTTPRGTLKLMSVANINEDGDQMTRLVYAENDGQKQFLIAAAATMKATHDLSEAAAAKFAPPGFDAATRDARRAEAIEQMQADIDDLEPAVKGDTATISLPGGDVVTLKLVDGKWYLPFSAIYHDKADPQEQVKVMGMISTMYQGLTADVNSGKIASLDDLQAEVQQRSIDLDKSVKAIAATQPTTQPATKP